MYSEGDCIANPGVIVEPQDSEELDASATLEAAIANLPEPQARPGNNIGANIARENILLISGPRSDPDIATGISMVQSLLKTFVRGMDHRTLSVQFPKVLEQIHGGVNFSYSTSNTI